MSDNLPVPFETKRTVWSVDIYEIESGPREEDCIFWPHGSIWIWRGKLRNFLANRDGSIRSHNAFATKREALLFCIERLEEDREGIEISISAFKEQVSQLPDD